MNTIDLRAGRMHCLCPPAPNPGAFWDIVSWTGWGVMLAAIVVMVVAGARFGLRRTTCGGDDGFVAVMAGAGVVALLACLVAYLVPH